MNLRAAPQDKFVITQHNNENIRFVRTIEMKYA